MSKRDDFTQLVKKQLCDRVGSLCSNPSCKKLTKGPDLNSSNKVSNIGIAAHIHAASPGGSRYNAEQSSEERRSIDNGIWLCSNCSILIDNNNGNSYPVELLLIWKKEAEGYAARLQSQDKETLNEAWLYNINGICYVNLPRLPLKFSPDELNFLPKNIERLSSLGIELSTILHHIKEVFSSSANYYSVDISNIINPSDELIGLNLSFGARSFYTRNANSFKRQINEEYLTSFNPEKSPYIYTEVNGYKYILAYNPKWITTSTAHVSFSSGRIKFSGIGIIKGVDSSEKLIFVSPTILGFPAHDFNSLILKPICI